MDHGIGPVVGEGVAREILGLVGPDEHVDGGIQVRVLPQLPTSQGVLEHLAYLRATRFDHALAK